MGKQYYKFGGSDIVCQLWNKPVQKCIVRRTRLLVGPQVYVAISEIQRGPLASFDNWVDPKLA